MLSKKANDLIFLILIVISIIAVVAARFIVLGNIDTRIDDTQVLIDERQADIDRLETLLQQHGRDTLPSWFELYEILPDDYDRERLMADILFYLARSEINPLNPPVISATPVDDIQAETDFFPMLQQIDFYRVTVSFNVTSIQQFNDFLEDLEDAKQVFVIEKYEYDLRFDDIIVEIRLLVPYSK